MTFHKGLHTHPILEFLQTPSTEKLRFEGVAQTRVLTGVCRPRGSGA
jgi:hypothetical protein